ncbi:transglycosylase SLT domain-containing protein [Nocardia tengchongensis]|uniref:transglycosylase SLT domain-containing protein n=1 Tax=Nocardia tengchongensis TaxID=2055889 RepID=UPI00364B1004
MATGSRPQSRTARRLAACTLAAASLSIVATAQASALVPDSSAKTLPAAVSVAATKIAPTAAAGSDLDGWIREAMAVMAAHGIPGSYDGIHRNIMRESGGDPGAINLYDSNAAAGIPSKGLLQVIDPTFQAYHVDGTSWDIWDPVANITAACNYAAARYGSMDNVDSAY